MLLKFPWLSKYGTTQRILKLAMQLIVFRELFCGSRYKSAGTTITELARITGGGNEKTLQTPALAKAAAIVALSVVTAAGI